MARYAYINLDKFDPDITRQADLLDSIGEYEKIFVDGQGVKGNVRRQEGLEAENLAKAVAVLKPGDCLFVAGVDRIAVSISSFLKVWEAVKKARADLVCMDISFDSRSNATATVIRTLEAFARIEADYSSLKKKEGIEAARKNGRRIGRPPVSVPPGFRDICKKWAVGEMTGVEAIRYSGMRSTSFYKKAAELGFVREIKDKK